MAVAKKKPIAKNAVIANTIASSVANLKTALENAGKAVTQLTSESKKLMLETRRLKKRRIAQMGKKKRAVAAYKKNATVDSAKVVKVATSELVATDKTIVKTTAIRQTVLAELSGLKESQKILSAYVKGINAADRTLNTKKRRVKRRVKPQVE
jgi:hypothetical protein